MGCFSCFDSKEDEKLNPNPQQQTHNHDHHNHNLPSAASGGGAEKLRSTSNGGASKREFPGLLKDGPPGQIAAQTFTFRELALATKNFRPQSFLGEGGFGRVYRGRLESTSQAVAVKQLDKDGLQGNREFLVEVLMLSLLHHPNLVSLIGYCADGDQRLLVYEFMPLGSLEDHLHDLPPDKEPLDWNTRMKIAAGAAKGLEYLHDKANPPVIYRDFKSSNILLEEGYHPKLSDFGLAKLGPVGDKSHVSTRVMGTYGYCAPEYAMTGQLTVKSDVYSFGVVFLELITGRKAIDSTRPHGEQNLVTWAKKGAQLLKYGRKGKPKFCPFRLSHDGSSLIWISSSGEKQLKLSSVSRIIPGQRTAVFQRYLRPEKDYVSFSLIYKNGKRSLDLICKDKVEADVWISGLKKLISSGQGGRSKIDGWSDGGLNLDDNKDLTSNSPSDSSASASLDISSPDISASLPNTSPNSFRPDNTLNTERSHAPSDSTNMLLKGSSNDTFRVSVSSAPSTSSHGSAHDDYDALADVYIWGEIICENVKVDADKSVHYISPRADVLLPRPLESNVVLDIQHIACGVRHASLVTRQGEVFTWGEESGGRLGHGVGKNVVQPRLVEALTSTTVDFVACGEFHSCAVTMTGELYTWGDGTHNAGLLGHGSNVSQWMPKRVEGSLEGLQVSFVACGPWHTALITSTGKLFTFGDGTFGVLGHGDRENVSYPREVESLLGLRTIAVACGVWHTAAVVEVIATQSIASLSSGKLFTWGDGDKNRLGHGDKEARLTPTCVPAIIDYDFQRIACGHSLTVGLTTSGRVFTMGSTVYGQLGNPQSDGKLPCLVGDKIASESVEEIACGAYHVAVLTSKNEVYTWGKGSNGRLGHGDIEDRKTPTLVEALKDRHVKYIACGSNYSAAICLHKWVSGAEQSQCSACRQAFGFTRKRHNCYNCGLVHCHSCSSKKALRAALSPNPDKPYRVCDSCYAKLSKVAEANNHNRRNTLPRLSGENKDRLDKSELRLSKAVVPSNMDLIKQLDNKAAKQGKKADTFSLYSQTPLLQLRDVVFSTAAELRRTTPKLVITPSRVSSRSTSPFSRRSSPPRSATPIPTMSGLSFSKNTADSLKKTNEHLNQEVQKLRSQVENLKQRCKLQELELQRSAKKTQEAMALATEESTKRKAAKEVMKSLTSQIKDLAEKLPPEVYDAMNIRQAYLPNGLESNGNHYLDSNGEQHADAESIISGSSLASIRLESSLFRTAGDFPGANGTNLHQQIRGIVSSNGTGNYPDIKSPNGSGVIQSSSSSLSDIVEGRDTGNSRDDESGLKSTDAALATNSNNQVDAEWIEQYEPGVYITLVAMHDGTRDLKRVRFSRRRFGENQAEIWWSENREMVYEKYNVRNSDKSSSQAPHKSEVGGSPISQT